MAKKTQSLSRTELVRKIQQILPDTSEALVAEVEELGLSARDMLAAAHLARGSSSTTLLQIAEVRAILPKTTFALIERCMDAGLVGENLIWAAELARDYPTRLNYIVDWKQQGISLREIE